MSADDVRVAYPLFQGEGSGAIPTSALQLEFGEITWKTYQTLNQEWHSRMPSIPDASAHSLCYGAIYDGVYYAVAGWSHPVARCLPQKTYFELRRFAIATDAPINTASRFLGWMTRDIHKRRPQVERLISYQDTEVHKGTIYKAAGWICTTKPRYRRWNMPNRQRNETQGKGPKVRWEKVIQL